MFRSSFFGQLFKPSGILLLLFSLLVLVYLFFSPSLATPAYPQDTFFLLSDGWRFANGQIPYKDYHSELGPLSGLLTGLGMVLRRPGSGLAHSVLIGQGIFSLFLLPASLFVAYRRLSSPVAALFCFMVVSLLASRIALGDPFSSHFTVTGIYNAQGYALLLVFSLLVLVRPLNESRRLRIIDDVMAGALLLLMFFDKLNYFGAGIAILIAASSFPPLFPKGIALGISVLSGIRIFILFIIFFLLLLIVFRIPPMRVFDDVFGLFHAQMAKMGGSSRLGRIPKIVFDAMRQYALILFGFPLVLRFVHGRLALQYEIALITLAVFLFGLSVGVMIGNSLQAADMFLLLLLALISQEVFARVSPTAPSLGKMAVLSLLILVVFQHQAVAVLSTLRAANIEFRSGKSANRWLQGTGLADLVIPPDEGRIDLILPPPSDWSVLTDIRQVDTFGGNLSMYEISQVASEGKCLLDQNVSSADRIYTDGEYYNIFSLMRMQSPPNGGGLGFGAVNSGGGDFDEGSGSDQAKAALADATVIMAPRNNVMAPVFGGMPATEGALRDFLKVGESRYWSLWRRGKAAHPLATVNCAPVPSR